MQFTFPHIFVHLQCAKEVDEVFGAFFAGHKRWQISGDTAG